MCLEKKRKTICYSKRKTVAYYNETEEKWRKINKKNYQ